MKLVYLFCLGWLCLIPAASAQQQDYMAVSVVGGKIELRTELNLRRVVLRYTQDEWVTYVDDILDKSGPGKYQFDLSRLNGSRAVEFCLAAEDFVEDRFVWLNNGGRNYRYEGRNGVLSLRAPGEGFENIKFDRIQHLEDQKNQNLRNNPQHSRIIFSKKVEPLLTVPHASGDPRIRVMKSKVYLSLTTSPQRIGQVVHRLRELDLTYIRKIFLSIPERYGRDGATYVIPNELRDFPKLEILRTDRDLGPIMKLLPAAELLQQTDPTGVLVTMDDDIRYPAQALNELIIGVAHHPGSVLSGSGQRVEYWGIPETAFPTLTTPAPKLSASSALVDVIEGFGLVAYPVDRLNTPELRRISGISKYTYASDDLVISYVLAKHGVPRVKFQTRHFNSPLIQVLGYGQGADALHKGAGVGEGMGESGVENINAKKYQQAFQDILGHERSWCGGVLEGAGAG